MPDSAKQNKLFLNKRTVPLKSELIKIEKIKSEDGKTETYYHYNVYVEIDKRVAIEKNVQNITVEISGNSLNELNNRESLLDGVNTSNPSEVNLLATNANIFRINSTVDNKRSKKVTQVGRISSDEVFDNNTASKIKHFGLPDAKVFLKKRKRYVLKELLGNQNNARRNYLSLHQAQGKKVKDIIDPRRLFKRKYNKMLRVGQNPADLINAGITSNNQTSFNFLKGRMNLINKVPQHFLRNSLTSTIDSISNSTPNQSGELSSGKFELVLEENSDRNAVLKQTIKIHEKEFLKLKKGNLRVIFIAKNDKNVSLDVTEGFLNHFEEKKKLSFPNFDYTVSSAKNYRGDIRIQIKNNDKKERFFNVYALKKLNYLEYSQQEFDLVKRLIRIKPGHKKIIFKNSARYNDSKSTFFRVNIVHDGIEYANSKFISYTTKNSPSFSFLGGIVAKITDDRHVIEVKNIPIETKRVQVIRRNLSKKESKFSLIKRIDKKSKNDLVVDVGKVIKENDEVDILVFNDDDVEKNNVYEYKVRIYDENGTKKESVNSCIQQYVEKTGFLNLEGDVTIIRQNPKRSVYNLAGTVEKIETDADKVFSDLFGRFYDLFEEDLKEIKDLNALTYDLLIEAYNKDTGETAFVTTQTVDIDGKFNRRISLENFNSYMIKITPRVVPPAEIIAKISNRLPELAKKARFVPVSAFNTAAIKNIARNGAMRFVSQTGIKYSDRSNRTRGKIVDNKTSLRESNFDLYFDGETGDNLYIDVLSNTKEINQNINLIRSKIKIVKKEKSELNNYNNKNYELGEEKYLATFSLLGLTKNLDFFIMSYTENGNTTTDGMAYLKIKNSNRSIVNYVYTIPNLYGKIDFYAQPIIKNGNILDKIKIGTIFKDDTGTR